MLCLRLRRHERVHPGPARIGRGLRELPGAQRRLLLRPLKNAGRLHLRGKQPK